MKTTTLILSAIIAALPFTANAENISGAMYLSPVEADTNHPAPTTGYAPPYGRVNIDTTDQNHIATTAYVKGAYNSAIAAVNSSFAGKIDNEQVLSYTDLTGVAASLTGMTAQDVNGLIQEIDGPSGFNTITIPSTGALLHLVNEMGTAIEEDIAYQYEDLNGQISALGDEIGADLSNNYVTNTSLNSKRVTVYTTWGVDDGTAVTQVPFSTAQ